MSSDWTAHAVNTPAGEHHMDEDPIYLVRSIGRMAQMLLEIRDEYVDQPSPDALDQFERRLEELSGLASQLRLLREAHPDLD